MVDSSTLAALRRSGTAVIADVCDNRGVAPPVLANDLWPVGGEDVSFAGPAYTVDGVLEAGPFQPDLVKLEALDAMRPGEIALFAGGGMAGVCAFGDLLASAMKCRGVAGVVVDGGVRDLAYLRGLGIPMLVRYRTPAQAIGRWKVRAHNVPVAVRGALAPTVAVAPGDILVGDADGVIVLAAADAAGIATEAAAWEGKDAAARRDILAGMPLLEARRKHGAL